MLTRRTYSLPAAGAGSGYPPPARPPRLPVTIGALVVLLLASHAGVAQKAIGSQPQKPLSHVCTTQTGLFSIVYPAYPTVHPVRKVRNSTGQLVEVGVQELEMPASAKANSAYAIAFSPADTTLAAIRRNLSASSVQLDKKLDHLFGTNGTIVYARVAAAAELAPRRIMCEELVWRDKQGNIAYARTFYYRGLAIVASVMGTSQTHNQAEVASFLYSFRPL